MELLVVAALAVPLLWGVFVYNRFVGARNRVLAAWSDIDVQLKRRHDLIPKLVEAVRQYAAYEKATLENVTRLRAESERSARVRDVGALESELDLGIKRLIALVERYPDLAANQSFVALQRDLSDVENHIQFARRYYNGAVRLLNTRIDSFPDNIVAKLFRFVHADYFELEHPDERHTPEVG